MMDIDPSRPEQLQTGEGPLSLSDFAQRNQMTEDRVWELIEEGELAARFVNDAILILREQDHLVEFADPQSAAMAEPRIEFHEAPTLAISAAEVLPAKPMMPDDIRPVAPDIDSLADDRPDLPTDDYRDLLVFAQDAMNRTMDLSRQLLSTKDELIRMKDERIQQLETEMQRNEQQIRRLKKQVEDLETLCRLTPSL
jgi:hypothetical protein